MSGRDGCKRGNQKLNKPSKFQREGLTGSNLVFWNVFHVKNEFVEREIRSRRASEEVILIAHRRALNPFPVKRKKIQNPEIF